MWNLLERPIDIETLDAWAKWLEDIGKVSALAVPVLAYGEYSILFKVFNCSALIWGTYGCMLLAKHIRRNKVRLSSPKGE